jgi:RNA polymerase sigma-32 factor
MARYMSEEPGFQAYVDAVERFPVLTREEELELATRWREQGDRHAADALVQGHLRSVVKIAKKYRGYGIYLSDLVAEGNLGLLEAVDRFEPERGLRFFTYARHWVRAFILAHVLKHWSIVDLGTTALQSKMFFRLQAEHARLMTSLGESDESIEARLADKFQTSSDQVRTNLQRLGRRDASLDAPVLDGSITFLDTLQNEELDQESQMASAELSSVVRAAVEEIRPTLDCRERIIMDERLLPADGDARTLAAIGRQLNLTRERVRQLEAGVKVKLREVLGRRLTDGFELAAPSAAAA